jgi:uncharacterized protein (TIGR00369 family)
MTNRDMQAAQLAAQGWKQRQLAGFIETAGPLWTRREADGWAYGLLLGPEHANPAGVAHGGSLVTLADHAISTVAWEAAGRTPCVTVQLDTHFLSSARPGDFVEARAQVRHRSGGMVFMQGTVSVGDRLVLAAQAVMKVVQG